MFQALPGFYFLFFAFQCWGLNSGPHAQVFTELQSQPYERNSHLPASSVSCSHWLLHLNSELQPETFGLFFYEHIMSIPKMNPYATPFLQDLPSRVLCDTPPRTPFPSMHLPLVTNTQLWKKCLTMITINAPEHLLSGLYFL